MNVLSQHPGTRRDGDRAWRRCDRIILAAALGAGIVGNTLGFAQQPGGASHAAPVHTEIWYGTQRVTPPRGVERPTLEQPPTVESQPAMRREEQAVVPATPPIMLEEPPRRLPIAPRENPLRGPSDGETLPEMHLPEGALPGPADETESVVATHPYGVQDTSPMALGSASLRDELPAEGVQIHRASLWQNAGTSSTVTPAVVADPAPERTSSGFAPLSGETKDVADERLLAVHEEGLTSDDDSFGWRHWTFGVGLFLSGAILGPVVVALALVRFLRRNQGPLFRIEIVNAPGSGIPFVSSVRTSETPSADTNHHVEPSEHAQPARRGAASLEPPPLELPAQETFVVRRRREQEQQREVEQQILEQLFEENLELRRQMEQ